MAPRIHSRVALVLGFVLLALHLDFWRPQRAVLYWGWLPEELAWRLAWMGAAFLYLLHFCAHVWRERED